MTDNESIGTPRRQLTRTQKIGGLSIGAFLFALLGGQFLGLPPHYGEDPLGEIGGNFEPTEFNVIYLKFAENGGEPRLKVRHAFFPVAAGQDEYGKKGAGSRKDDVECAVNFLKNDGSVDDDCGAINRKGMGQIGTSFDTLRYQTQTRIYVLVDNDGVAFNQTTPLSFTPFGPFDKVSRLPWRRTRDKNRTFGSAKFKPLGGTNRTLLYFQNHYKNSFGWPMRDGQATTYSINFNLLVCRKALNCVSSNEDEVFPIIVDPDTGNGNDG